eukprot:6945916-Lingulodinium_polyedra.AAC.1
MMDGVHRPSVRRSPRRSTLHRRSDNHFGSTCSTRHTCGIAHLSVCLPALPPARPCGVERLAR